MKPFKRIIWIVLDGVGVGALPDAKKYGDLGSDSIGNVSKKRPLHLPTLEKMGLGNLTAIQGVRPLRPGDGIGAYGKAFEKSSGKDTTTGHWEMAGLILKKAFKTYPNGFPKKAIDAWVKASQLPGTLGNYAASGTIIIDELGPEHVKTGKPILYTSADSVWQVAAHEEFFGLDRLYTICKSARKICDELNIGRVIARPFIGDPTKGIPFKRTYNRKDYAVPPSGKTVLDHLKAKKIQTLGIGKIGSIFSGHGINDNWDTAGNQDGMEHLSKSLSKMKKGVIFCNLIDTDMLFGHRRDIEGYARCLEDFDTSLGKFLNTIGRDDLVIVTSDHGNDPTFSGTDHTREFVPILAYSPGLTSLPGKGAINLGTRKSFSDIGSTVYQSLVGLAPSKKTVQGDSFFKLLTQTK